MSQNDYRGVLHLRSSTIVVRRPVFWSIAWGTRYRTTRRRHMHWWLDVYNERTGVRVAGDDFFGELHEVLPQAAQYVQEVRSAWTRGYLKKRFM